jgi:hypothetical protein
MIGPALAGLITALAGPAIVLVLDAAKPGQRANGRTVLSYPPDSGG